MVERTDDEWIALAALAGAEFYTSNDGRWFVRSSGGGMHPIEERRLARQDIKGFSFASLAEISRAYCEWLDETHR
jgi:hypothetical protein